MTPADRRLAALLAVFAASRARALAGRIGGAGAEQVAELAGRLAEAPRRDRLAALEAALRDGAERRAAAAWVAIASRERARVARALAVARPGSASDRARGSAAVLARLSRELLHASASRPR